MVWAIDLVIPLGGDFVFFDFLGFFAAVPAPVGTDSSKLSLTATFLLALLFFLVGRRPSRSDRGLSDS